MLILEEFFHLDYPCELWTFLAEEKSDYDPQGASYNSFWNDKSKSILSDIFDIYYNLA